MPFGAAAGRGRLPPCLPCQHLPLPLAVVQHPKGNYSSAYVEE